MSVDVEWRDCGACTVRLLRSEAAPEVRLFDNEGKEIGVVKAWVDLLLCEKHRIGEVREIRFRNPRRPTRSERQREHDAAGNPEGGAQPEPRPCRHPGPGRK